MVEPTLLVALAGIGGFALGYAVRDGKKTSTERRDEQPSTLAMQRELMRNREKLEARVDRYLDHVLGDGLEVGFASGRFKGLKGPCQDCGGPRHDHYVHRLGHDAAIWTCEPIEPYQPPKGGGGS